MYIKALAALALFSTTPIQAIAMAPDKCEILRESFTITAVRNRSLLENLETFNLQPMEAHLSDDMKENYQRMVDTKEVLLVALRDWTEATEDMAYKFQVCARQ